MERNLQTSLRFTLLRRSTTIVVKIFQTSNKENNFVTFAMAVFFNYMYIKFKFRKR